MPSRLVARCRFCPKADECDHKEMELCGYLKPAAELASVNAATAIAVKHDYRQIKIGTDTEVTIDLEEVKEKLAVKLNPFTAYLKEVGG